MRVLFRVTFLLLGINALVLTGWLVVRTDDQPQTHWLSFVSSRTGYLDTQLYQMRADGKLVRQLTDRLGKQSTQRSPSWSPSGDWIAFSSFGAQPQIYRIRPDGHEFQLLVPATAQYTSMTMPAWSHDGEKLAFIAREGGLSQQLFIMDLLTNSVIQVTSNTRNVLEPNWSPDSQWIAYATNVHGPFEIYKVRIDGSDSQRLTNTLGHNNYPTWSPDGKWIAFASSRDGKMQIYKMRDDGSDVHQLTTNDGASTLPTWSPDGKWIAFVTERTGKPEIFRMRPDGSHLQQLTESPGDNLYPDWGPNSITHWNEWVTLLFSLSLIGLFYCSTLVERTMLQRYELP